MEKKLYKSTEDRVISGVCGGIAEYFTVDPVIIRLFVVILTLMGGIGLIFYIAAAIIMKDPPSQMSSAFNGGQSGTETYTENGQANSASSADTGSAESSDTDSTEFSDADSENSFEARQKAYRKRRNTGGIVIGAILVGLGALYIVRWFFPWFSSGLVMAGLAIVLGIVLIARR